MEKGKWEFFKGNKENWFSEPLYNWMNLSEIPEAPWLKERCTTDRIRQALSPWSDLFLIKLEFFPEGSYREEGTPRLSNIQGFYMATIRHRISGSHTAQMKILLPVALLMIVYLMVILYGQSMANNVMLEKNSKLIETILTAVATSLFAMCITATWALAACSIRTGYAYNFSYGLFPVVSLSSELLNVESENVFEVE